jgi:hypothetical protein
MPAGRLATLPGTSLHLAAPTRIVSRSHIPHRALRLCLVLTALAIVSGIIGGSATAQQKPCADQVVSDWYDDGRVDKIYPFECYRQAIKSLPPDVIDYSNAKEEIGRALAFAKQGKPDPGGEDPTPATTPTGTQATGTGTNATETTGTETTGTETGTDPTATGTSETPTDTSGPSSVPVPLIVLGGLAILLLAAGSAGYLRRRMNGGDDGDASPPASA